VSGTTTRPQPDATSEQILLRRLRRHDEAAFNEIVLCYQDRVFGLCLRMLGSRDEAEEIAQEVFCTVFRTVRQFRGESKFSTWLYRVTLNHCKNRMKYLGRRHYRETRSIEDVQESRFDDTTLPVDSGRPDRRLEGAELQRLVGEEILALEEEQRALLLLRDVQELSYAEIVEISGLPEGTVKSRLHRARMALKERLTRRLGRSEPDGA